MTTRLILRPGTDRRTPAEKQETALVAAFRKMDARARVRLLRAASSDPRMYYYRYRRPE